MLRKTVLVAGSSIESPLREDQAQSVRDSLAQTIYGQLFEWLVHQMNKALSLGSGDLPGDRSFSVLDIAGFEHFEENSLEQLLINLSNEHLQQSFNSFIFKSELEDYAKEGIALGDKVD